MKGKAKEISDRDDNKAREGLGEETSLAEAVVVRESLGEAVRYREETSLAKTVVVTAIIQ